MTSTTDVSNVSISRSAFDLKASGVKGSFNNVLECGKCSVYHGRETFDVHLGQAAFTPACPGPV